MDRAEARSCIEAYAPLNADDSRYREQMLELLAAEAPFSRAHFTPGHFTVSAFVLSPERQRVLLIHHRKLALWLQPGGHLELDDASFEAACRREVREEVGITALTPLVRGVFDLDVHEIPAWKSDAAHRHFDVRFLFVAESASFVESEEVAGVRWANLSELASVTEDESVRRAARKAHTLVERMA